MSLPFPSLSGRRPRLFASACLLLAASVAAAIGKPVSIEIYGQAGCDMCRRVDEEVVPVLQAQFGEYVRVEHRDVGDPTELARLLAVRNRTTTNDNPRVCVVVAGSEVLADKAVFSEELPRMVERHLLEMLNAGGSTNGTPPVIAEEPPAETIRSSYRSFGWGLVLLAGLADGFNPCAIGTLVFFVSLLAAGRAGRRRAVAAGVAFCMGVFATYVAMGFGLLHACRAAEALPVVRFWFRVTMSGMLAVLAALSFRDAAAYARSGGRVASITLKLPHRLVELTRRLAKQGVAARWLLPGCAAVGVAVTVIEAVCTGQTYLPTLAFMSQQGSLRAMSMLLAYNGMFVLPLVVILAASLLGWRSVDMVAWARREVVAAKVALGLIFVAMAAALWLVV